MTSRNPTPARMREIHDALCSLYPDAYSPLLEPRRGNPVDVLVATILSQATSDVLSSRAFDALKQAFPTWEAVLDADPVEVERLLAVGGLQREKTRKIRAALARLRDDFGGITLNSLSRWPCDSAYGYLVSLPGVGPKTAACVICFGLGRPAFPVDTHVLRIARRLGLVPGKAGAGKTQEVLESVTPPEIKTALHVMMICHGRSVCLPGRPRCQGCPLRDGCNPGLK